MKRKVIKQGNGTLTVTLPKKWTEIVGLKGGDEIEVTELDKKLIVGEPIDKREIKAVADVTGLDRSTILILIQGFYRYGYDEIEITSDDITVPHYRVGKQVSLSSVIYSEVQRFVGTEVISASQKRYVIKRLSEETPKDFPAILRRIFLLLNEMMDSFIDGTKKDDPEILESIEFQHINIKKFINFALRLLNKFGYKDSKKTCFYFNVISFLSKTEDLIKNSSRYLLKHRIKIKSQRALELFKDIRESIRLYYELFYSYDMKKVANLDKQRDSFREKLFRCSKELSKEESIIIGGLSQVVELILDMTETRMALED